MFINKRLKKIKKKNALCCGKDKSSKTRKRLGEISIIFSVMPKVTYYWKNKHKWEHNNKIDFVDQLSVRLY